MEENFYRLPGPEKLRIALVSDLHSRPFDAILAPLRARAFDEVISSLRARKPALICIPGDFLHGVIPRGGLDFEATPVPAFLRACAALAPTFVSLGNHEWPLAPEDLASIRETGVTLLDDAWTRFGPLVIGGLSSAYVHGYRRWRAEQGGKRYPVPDNIHRIVRGVRPDTGWLGDYCAQEGWRLMLCHHPEYWPRYLRELPIPLTLSGHAHGGQIRLFGHGLYAPGQGFLPRYTSGLYEDRLLVGRGLSNNVIVPRLFNPTELVYLDLED